LEFSPTRAHYLVFKEQILLHKIIGNFLPLSRGLFLFRALAPAAAIIFVTDPRFPVKHPEKKFFSPGAPCRFPSFSKLLQ
jgi:hypothetical protein